MKIGLFLVHSKSLFQGLQKATGLAAAKAAGATVELSFAEGSSKTQREQMFAYLRQTESPTAVVVEPVEDAGLRFVAQEALRKGIVCAVLNRSAPWVEEVRQQVGGTAFCVTPDQHEIGRVQGEQYKTLLPNGGKVLYITGPSLSSVAQQRMTGMTETKGAKISIQKVTGNWTEKSGYDAMRHWCETTRGLAEIHLIGSQNDDMALGAHKAAAEMAGALGKPVWKELPVLGVDGVPDFGIRLLREHILTATVVMPASAGRAIELLASVLRGGTPPPPITTLPVVSQPPLAQLRPIG